MVRVLRAIRVELIRSIRCNEHRSQLAVRRFALKIRAVRHRKIRSPSSLQEQSAAAVRILQVRVPAAPRQRADEAARLAHSWSRVRHFIVQRPGKSRNLHIAMRVSDVARTATARVGAQSHADPHRSEAIRPNRCRRAPSAQHNSIAMSQGAQLDLRRRLRL